MLDPRVTTLILLIFSIWEVGYNLVAGGKRMESFRVELMNGKKVVRSAVHAVVMHPCLGKPREGRASGSDLLQAEKPSVFHVRRGGQLT
ncbi:hypothetical protein [Mesorhizobium sp. P5_C1]